MDFRKAVNGFVIAALDALTIMGALLAAYLLWGLFAHGGTAIEISATALVALAVVSVPFALSTIFHRMLSRSRWEKMGPDA